MLLVVTSVETKEMNRTISNTILLKLQRTATIVQPVVDKTTNKRWGQISM
jgi:hypothetical protein